MTEQLVHHPRPIETVPDTAELDAHYAMNVAKEVETGTAAVKRRTAADRTADETATHPRMTPALQGALNDFITETTAPRQEREALRSLKKDNYSDYIDQLVNMSDKERNGEVRGRSHRARLLKENLHTSSKERLERGGRNARAIGRVAYALAAGVTAIGYRAASKKAAEVHDKANRKVFELQATRRYKKHMKQVQTEAIAENEAFDRRVRRTARRQRREELRERLSSPARRLGGRAVAFAERAYAIGLEQTDSARAKSFEQERLDTAAARRQAETDALVANVDRTLQGDRVNRLLDDERYGPREILKTESGDYGFVSDVFTSDHPEWDEKYAVMYGLQASGQVFPQLLIQRGDNSWEQILPTLPETYRTHDTTDELLTTADSMLRTINRRDGETTLTDRALENLVSQLDYRTKASVTTESQRKQDEIRNKRDALRKAAARRRKRNRRRPSSGRVYKITPL